MYAVDRTLSIGDRASELMRAYSGTATPRCYELWYTYVTGLKPGLNEAVKALIAANGKLSAGDVDDLFGQHVSGERLGQAADRTSGGLLIEIDQVMSLIEAAVGSTAQYGASLEALGNDLSSAEKPRMREVIEALVGATREVAASNKHLETRLRDSHGEIAGLREALEAVRTETLTDPLTGIANRKHFEAALATGVSRGQANGTSLILIVIDIDCFKRFNDTYGHLTGDQVIRLVAAAMRENVDVVSTLARFGGEEFAVLLPDATAFTAFTAAEKIRRNVMGRELLKRSTGESLGRVTVSLGIATLRADDTPASLMGRADACMYRAKRSGRNRTIADWDEVVEEVSSAA